MWILRSRLGFVLMDDRKQTKASAGVKMALTLVQSQAVLTLFLREMQFFSLGFLSKSQGTELLLLV